MDGKEGVAAPQLTYCKCYVVILENWYSHPLGERKKTLMVSKSLLKQVSSQNFEGNGLKPGRREKILLRVHKFIYFKVL